MILGSISRPGGEFEVRGLIWVLYPKKLEVGAVIVAELLKVSSR